MTRERSSRAGAPRGARSRVEPHHERDWLPLDPPEHRRQLAAVVRALPAPPAVVLDLGAGGGRIAAPLARRGDHVVAVDRDERALAALNALALPGLSPRRVELGSARQRLAPPRSSPRRTYDAALCLGYTLLQITDLAALLRMFRAVRRVVRPGAVFLLDDLCVPLWREVAEGNWQEGTSPDGSAQLLWVPGESTIALRRGREVRPGGWSVRESDRRLRLWTLDELAFVGGLCGWSPPQRRPAQGVMLLHAR